MKIEVKHLSPFLPYGLQLIQKNDWHSQDWSKYRIIILDQLSHSVSPDAHWFYIGGAVLGDEKTHVNYEHEQFKPIMRPLTDLTKVIEVNGESFLPYDKLKSVVQKEQWIKICETINNDYDKICDMPYWWVRQIISWHFDIDGLIEAGYAVDINTLEKSK